MAREAYNEANDLFVDEAYEDALNLYTKAITLDGNTAEYYIKRSACHEKLKRYTDAVDDALTAIKLDPENSNAYLRKGIACFYLEEFETAKAAFEDGLTKKGAKESVFKTWIRKCDAEIAEEEEGNNDQNTNTNNNDNTTTTTQNTTTKQEETKMDEDVPPPLEEGDDKKSSSSSSPQIITNPDLTGLPVGNIVIPKKESKVNHSWYQTNDYVFIDFFVKGLKPKDVDVEFQDNAVEVSIRIDDSADWVYDKVLSGRIDPKESKFTILSTKVEVKLKKEKAGQQWASLEKLGNAPDIIIPTPDKVKHVYPSSKGPKNWDKIAAEIPDEKLEGEQALNKVFQQIFSGGTDEQRKAMIKSFTESGGTVLSTNWDEVGKGKVKGSPPKGMEMHSWDELTTGKPNPELKKEKKKKEDK